MDLKINKDQKNVIFFICFIIIFILLAFYVIFGKTQITRLFTNKPTIKDQIKHYKTLDKNLNVVINATNPQQSAEEIGLALDTNSVKVLIKLKDESFIFTQTYGTQQIRYGKFIQASIKLNELENLAKNKKIETIISVKASTSNRSTQ